MMTIPEENDLVPRRVRWAARRTEHLAGYIQAIAFLKTHGMGPPDSLEPGAMVQTFEVRPGSFEERKARADQLARAYGAATEWRNGYYMAVREDALVRMEFHFFPLILAADAEE
jgi:hypothetical protein